MAYIPEREVRTGLRRLIVSVSQTLVVIRMSTRSLTSYLSRNYICRHL